VQPGDLRAHATGGRAEGTSAAPDHELAAGDVAAEPELPQVPAAAELIVDEQARRAVRRRIGNAGRSQIDDLLIRARQAGQLHDARQPVAVEMRERDPVAPRCDVDAGVQPDDRPAGVPPQEPPVKREPQQHPLSGLEALRAVLMVALPLTSARQQEWRVWLSFWGVAWTSPALSAEHRNHYQVWRGFIHRALRDAAQLGQVRPGLDLREATDRLVALVDGLGLQSTYEPRRLTPERVMAIVDGQLAEFAVTELRDR
jgi:BetI-type transcriptional repressor, C-terminal